MLTNNSHPFCSSSLPRSYNTAGSYGLYGKAGRPSAPPLHANRAAGAAAMARADAAGLRGGGWPAPSWAADGGPNSVAPLTAAEREALIAAEREEIRRWQAKLRRQAFVLRLFPGLSCFLPEVEG